MLSNGIATIATEFPIPSSDDPEAYYAFIKDEIEAQVKALVTNTPLRLVDELNRLTEEAVALDKAADFDNQMDVWYNIHHFVRELHTKNFSNAALYLNQLYPSLHACITKNQSPDDFIAILADLIPFVFDLIAMNYSTIRLQYSTLATSYFSRLFSCMLLCLLCPNEDESSTGELFNATLFKRINSFPARYTSKEMIYDLAQAYHEGLSEYTKVITRINYGFDDEFCYIHGYYNLCMAYSYADTNLYHWLTVAMLDHGDENDDEDIFAFHFDNFKIIKMLENYYRKSKNDITHATMIQGIYDLITITQTHGENVGSKINRFINAYTLLFYHKDDFLEKLFDKTLDILNSESVPYLSSREIPAKCHEIKKLSLEEPKPMQWIKSHHPEKNSGEHKENEIHSPKQIVPTPCIPGLCSAFRLINNKPLSSPTTIGSLTEIKVKSAPYMA